MLALASKKKKYVTNAFAAPTIMFLNTVVNAPFVLHALHVYACLLSQCVFYIVVGWSIFLWLNCLWCLSAFMLLI